MKNLKENLFIIFIPVLLIFSGISVSAQKLELNPFAGYCTGAKASANLGYLHFSNGVDLGLSADIGIGKGRYGEISYNHVSSSMNLEGTFNNQRITSLSVNYVSLGMLQEFIPGSGSTPYGLLSLGVVNYNPTESNYSGVTRMQISLAGGFKVRASERIGLRLQARLLLPYFTSDTYFRNGPDGTAYVIASGIRAVQGDITGGVIIFLK
jgi:hypothetical protein